MKVKQINCNWFDKDIDIGLRQIANFYVEKKFIMTTEHVTRALISFRVTSLVDNVSVITIKRFN